MQDVFHHYNLGKTNVQSLKKINLEINKSEIIALVGPSGSGKTTLINLIGTLDDPTKGNILVDRINIRKLTKNEKNTYRQKMVSFVFQSYNLLPTLTVYENIEFPLLFSSIASDQIQDRVNSAIKLVCLDGLGKRNLDELSGGQRQRVAIARAVVTNSPILLADEPTGNLDSDTAFKIMDLMVNMNHQLGTTIIFSTHDKRIMSYAHKIIELKDGEILRIDSK